jgi:TatD DNase family protein
MQESDWDELARLAQSDKVVGVGETGLDYHYDHSPRDVQRQAFARFIAMAGAVERPVVSHVRDAHDDAAEILAAEAARLVGGVIHSFTGTVEDARRYLDLGQHLSFSGILTFKNAADLRAAAAFAPLDRILVETDSPYLTPVPHRGKRNEPALVQHTVAALAAVRGIPPEDAARATAENARRLFKLD